MSGLYTFAQFALKLALVWLAVVAPVSLTLTCALAVVAALPFGLYCTIMVHVLPAGTVKPDTHVPPGRTVKLLPAGPGVTTVTVGVAVSVSGPGFVDVALLVRVIVPL